MSLLLSPQAGSWETPGRGLLWASGHGGDPGTGQGEAQPCGQSGCQDAEM